VLRFRRLLCFLLGLQVVRQKSWKEGRERRLPARASFILRGNVGVSEEIAQDASARKCWPLWSGGPQESRGESNCKAFLQWLKPGGSGLMSEPFGAQGKLKVRPPEEKRARSHRARRSEDRRYVRH
jgi:hypothetical protein